MLLSEREKACLLWTARGKSSWEIGRIMGISEHTVVFHVRNAMKRLGTRNRMVAVVMAVQMGLIAPTFDDESILRRRGRA
jgi:DNA-binding CsgD family transcriptional regulator